MATNPARARFRALIRRPDAELSLAEAALCIAWEDLGACDVAGALRELDRLAAAARPALEAARGAAAQVEALSRFLFVDQGFRGNTWRYGDPQNSYLDRVLETRAGLPITLSVVTMEVGWRLGLPLAGLALPGHFLVQCPADPEPIYLDPFFRGRAWSALECERQVASFYGAVTPDLLRQAMAPPTKAAVLERMLRNLKGAYTDRGDLPRALAAIDRILLLAPEDASQLRDRGLLLARHGRPAQALEDLERYARAAPAAADLPGVRQRARALADALVGKS